MILLNAQQNQLWVVYSENKIKKGLRQAIQIQEREHLLFTNVKYSGDLKLTIQNLESCEKKIVKFILLEDWILNGPVSKGSD